MMKRPTRRSISFRTPQVLTSASPQRGTKGGGNAAALDLLKNHLGQNGNNVRYYAGDKPDTA
ncbi:MAG: hypothetical protein IPJ07_18155 [Acidobacteria bacterium]|nr:hypothetical protein [Acidobacteriota bacterium]